MNKKIKELRTILDLNQDSFGKKIGLSKSAVSNMESGRYNITDTIIITICKVFNVNEIWLRTGKGNIFIKDNHNILNKLIDEYNLNETDKKIINAYIQLNDTNREAFKNFLTILSNEYSSNIDNPYENNNEVLAYKVTRSTNKTPPQVTNSQIDNKKNTNSSNKTKFEKNHQIYIAGRNKNSNVNDNTDSITISDEAYKKILQMKKNGDFDKIFESSDPPYDDF